MFVAKKRQQNIFQSQSTTNLTSFNIKFIRFLNLNSMQTKKLLFESAASVIQRHELKTSL